jgi:folate-binding protein YgfZ
MLSVGMTSLTVAGGEYAAVTEGCGVLDRSERGKLALSGPDAKTFLQGQLTNDVQALVRGSGCYAAFLTPKGKMLGDVRVLDAGDELLLDTERCALQPLFNLIRRFSVGYQVELHKRTLERGLVSMVGPAAASVLGLDPGPDEHSHALGSIGSGLEVRAIRTDLGIDVLCEAELREPVLGALEAAGAVPVSEDVVECRRVERGRPRYGIDLDDTVIPQEAGLNERAVSFSKGCYVGQETVARLYYRGKPNRHLRGLRAQGQIADGDQIAFEDRTVGRVSSVAISPRLGPIALALVRREVAPGSIVSVGEAGVCAEVAELPFS